MKWIYLLLLVALIGGLLSSTTVRGFLFSSEPAEQPTEEPQERPTSGRLEEASGISNMHSEVSR